MKSAREEILEKLRITVNEEPVKPDFESPVYHSIQEPFELALKNNLEAVNGIVHLFTSKEELYAELEKFLSRFESDNICCFENEIQQQLIQYKIQFSKKSEIPENLEAGITGCEFLIAHTGSIMVSSAQEGGRQMFVFSPVHIVIASKKQIVLYLENAYYGIQKKYGNDLPSQITLITGPSRTADIEKTLVMGAHGPREIHVFIS